MKRFALFGAGIALLLAGMAPGAPAQTNPVSSAVRQIVAHRTKILVAAAEEMPADKYGFHPTPQQMTFGHLVMHMAGSNFFLCSAIAGTAGAHREMLSETDPKDKLVAALQSSFAYCTQVLSKTDDSKLGEQVPFFGGRKITRAMALIALTDDLFDHYSTAAMYLRLNGLLPPTAQPRKKK